MDSRQEKHAASCMQAASLAKHAVKLLLLASLEEVEFNDPKPACPTSRELTSAVLRVLAKVSRRKRASKRKYMLTVGVFIVQVASFPL